MCILNFLKIIWLKHFVIALPAKQLPQPHLTYSRKQTWRALVVDLDSLSPGSTVHQLKRPAIGVAFPALSPPPNAIWFFCQMMPEPPKPFPRSPDQLLITY